MVETLTGKTSYAGLGHSTTCATFDKPFLTPSDQRRTVNRNLLWFYYWLWSVLGASSLFTLCRQIAELKIAHEQERATLIRSHQAERDAVLKEQENERVRGARACLPFFAGMPRACMCYFACAANPCALLRVSLPALLLVCRQPVCVTSRVPRTRVRCFA